MEQVLRGMKQLMREAGITNRDVDKRFGIAWNFASQYLQNAKLVKLVAQISSDERLRIAENLLSMKSEFKQGETT